VAYCGRAIYHDDSFGRDEKECCGVSIQAQFLKGRSLLTLVVALGHHVGAFAEALDSITTRTNWNTCSGWWYRRKLRSSVDGPTVKRMNSTSNNTTDK